MYSEGQIPIAELIGECLCEALNDTSLDQKQNYIISQYRKCNALCPEYSTEQYRLNDYITKAFLCMPRTTSPPPHSLDVEGIPHGN